MERNGFMVDNYTDAVKIEVEILIVKPLIFFFLSNQHVRSRYFVFTQGALTDFTNIFCKYKIVVSPDSNFAFIYRDYTHLFAPNSPCLAVC